MEKRIVALDEQLNDYFVKGMEQAIVREEKLGHTIPPFQKVPAKLAVAEDVVLASGATIEEEPSVRLVYSEPLPNVLSDDTDVDWYLLQMI